MSRITILTKIALSTAFALAVAALTWATPGSAFVTTPLVRSTAATRINIKTHPNTLNDVQVQSVVAEPGGYSGWHSHPGPGIVAVRAGTVAIYFGDDPTCTPNHVGAGEVSLRRRVTSTSFATRGR
jgi:hypothetical protein